MEWEYFRWLIDSIDPNHKIGNYYQPVYEELYLTDFRWISKYSDDQNRAMDGVELRRVFADERGISTSEINIDWKRCSCLEMIIALARRIELEIVSTPANANIPRWFWRFMDNLGLSPNEPKIKDVNYISERINVWLNRTYSRDGKGGLFTLKSDEFDMRKMVIWKQMSAILNEENGYFDEF